MSRAREIADERFAAGEIDAAEHQRILAGLGVQEGGRTEPEPLQASVDALAKDLEDSRTGAYVGAAIATAAAFFLVGAIFREPFLRWFMNLEFVSSSDKPTLWIYLPIGVLASVLAVFFSDVFSKVLRNSLISKLNQFRPAAPVARLLSEKLVRQGSGAGKDVVIFKSKITGDVIGPEHVAVDLKNWRAFFSAIGVFFIWAWTRD
jgi:hypothetical protein